MTVEVLTTTTHHVQSDGFTFRVHKTPKAKVTIECPPIGAPSVGLTVDTAALYAAGLAKAVNLARELENPPPVQR